jgi:leucyl aminopeptidase
MKITFAAPALPRTGVLVAGVLEDRVLTQTARALDAELSGRIGRAVGGGRFSGKRDQTLALVTPADSELDRILLIGLGKPAELDALKLQALGGQIYAALGPHGHRDAVVAVDPIDGCALDPASMACEIALGASLRAYRFDKYLTKEKEEEKPGLAEMTLACADHGRARKLFQPAEKVVDAVRFTRDLVSEPANVINPETLAAEAKKLAKLGVEVEVLGEKEMKKLGLNALLGVGQGSASESRLVVMQWWGAGKSAEKSKKGKEGKEGKEGKGGRSDAGDRSAPGSGPLAFIGKGVTFDTGGISIKPSANMEDMKWDMAGAAAVIGTMMALAGRKARVDAIGIVGLVENMPSGTAQRPGDVVRSLSGQTIEVINTDAEGRLVLADALWYARDRFKPKLMIDLATLTGAIIISLGHEYAGLFANDEDLAARLIAAGTAVGEPLWRLPMGEAYDKLIKSDIADMKNVGNRGAGSITAAQFLQRFVDKTPWAHLDIAGTAWTKTDREVTSKGATGFGVRLLDRLVADSFEER